MECVAKLELNARLSQVPAETTPSTHLFHNRGQATQRQSVIVFSRDHGAAQLDDQTTGILELTALRELRVGLLQALLDGQKLQINK